MRNRKPSSGGRLPALPALPAEVGRSGGRRCADTPTNLFSPGILAGAFLGSNIWKRLEKKRGGTTQLKSQNTHASALPPPPPLKKK